MQMLGMISSVQDKERLQLSGRNCACGKHVWISYVTIVVICAIHTIQGSLASGVLMDSLFASVEVKDTHVGFVGVQVKLR